MSFEVVEIPWLFPWDKILSWKYYLVTYSFITSWISFNVILLYKILETSFIVLDTSFTFAFRDNPVLSSFLEALVGRALLIYFTDAPCTLTISVNAFIESFIMSATPLH
jgi:hypothetical protein